MSPASENPTPGTLYGLGIGPGDPELITLKALKYLRAAPILAYPAPLEGESMARRIAESHLPGGQTEIVIRTSYDENRQPAEAAYDKAAEEMAEHLSEGRDVALLCLGDPFLYGSFQYLFARLGDRFPVEVVPGVSAPAAGSAAAQMALAAGNDCLALIPATLDEDVIAARLEGFDAAVIVKVGRHFAKLYELLRRLGMAEKARYVERVSMAEERILPLGEVDPDSASYFSMILLHNREGTSS
ncbi:MAG: precorrin-2 C(20)-methyltransferase [Alphaproteobacteria bacterium]|nr:precorrin-2 C(20)-methyltransferase [Alphaproteobacteria bacterium]